MQTITREELYAAIASQVPPVLIEALGPAAYNHAHLPGALRLQLSEMSEHYVAELLPDPTQTIVTYCSSASCRASHGVATKLGRLGYADVRVYAGGKLDWIQSGLPVEQPHSDSRG